MKPWQRRSIGILTLGGGFLGLALSVQLLQANANSPAPVLNGAFILAFAATYAWGVWLGLRLLEQSPGTPRLAAVYWLLQVPYVMSPLAGYLFAGGALAYVTYSFGAGAGMHFRFGSEFTYSLMQADKPFAVGINVFALVVAIYLVTHDRRRDAVVVDAAEPDATAG